MSGSVRLPGAFRGGQPTLGGAVSPGQRPAALVPGGLGHRPERLAYLPSRPDRAATPAGPRFAPRALPPDREIAAQVARGVGEATWRYRARVIVHAPAVYVRGRLPIPAAVESLPEDQCAFEPGSDHPEMLALYLGMLDVDFTIVDSPELVDALRKLTRRYQRAIDSSQQTSG